jgi:enoyl-CoA hydratase/carnithine racemase
MAKETVHTEQRGRVLTVRLDNPPRNFMTTAMVGELLALVERLERDGSVGSVVITGAPEDVFITHFDVAEIKRGADRVGPKVSPGQAGGTLRAVGALERVPGARSLVGRSPAAGISTLLRIHELFLRMNRLDKVLIAAINGLALGGGCELALACDVRIMAQGDHRIGLPEITLGIIPGAGGTQRLSRALGPARALEMMLEGRVLTPAEAVQQGLVHRAVPRAALMKEARATAERLARRSPTAVGALKRAVYEGASRPLTDGLHLERAGFLAASSTPAAKRALGVYADEVAQHPGAAPWQAEELMRPWLEGSKTDLVERG